MTPKQKFITYFIALIGAWLFTWPVALFMLMLFADFNGEIPTKQEAEDV